MTFFHARCHHRLLVKSRDGFLAKLASTFLRCIGNISKTRVLILIVVAAIRHDSSALADDIIHLPPPLYNGVISGMASCGSDSVVVASVDGVYQFEWNKGTWRRELIDSLPSAGVSCSSSGEFLSAANETERHIYKWANKGWTLMDTKKEADGLSTAVFDGPSFLVELPNVIAKANPMVSGRIVSDIAGNGWIAPYQFDGSPIFDIASSFSSSSGSRIQIDGINDGSESDTISLVRVLFLDPKVPLPVFHLGGAGRYLIAWFSNSLNAWQAWTLPARADPFAINYSSSKAASLPQIRIFIPASTNQDAQFLDCATDVSLQCSSEPIWTPRDSRDVVSAVADAALLRNEKADCYRVATLSSRKVSPCFLAQWQGKSLNAVLFESTEERALVAFAIGDGGVEPEVFSTLLFDMPLP